MNNVSKKQAILALNAMQRYVTQQDGTEPPLWLAKF